MTTTLQPPARPQVGRRLFTVADLPRFPRSVASGDVSWELLDGVPVAMSPPGYRHGRIGGLVVAELHAHAERRGLGEVGDETAIILRRNPDRVVGADAVFLLAASLPPRLSPEGYLETIPELVIEVRSKNDSDAEVTAKVGEYVAAGVRAVWVLDPDGATVSVHVPAAAPVAFGPVDTLTSPLLPGFAVPVARLFPANSAGG